MQVLYLMAKVPVPANSGDAMRNWALLRSTRSVADRLDLITLPQNPGMGVDEGLARTEELCDSITVVGSPIGEQLGTRVNRLRTVLGRPYYHAVGHAADIQAAVRDRIAPSATTSWCSASFTSHRHCLPTSYPAPCTTPQRPPPPVAGVAGPYAIADGGAERISRQGPGRGDTADGAGRGHRGLLGAGRGGAHGNVPRYAEWSSSRTAWTCRQGHAHRRLRPAPAVPGQPRRHCQHRGPGPPGGPRTSATCPPTYGSMWQAATPRPVVARSSNAPVTACDTVARCPTPARRWSTPRALLVPLHTGGGTRLKVLEAFAVGLPVMSTSKGMEGIPVMKWPARPGL